MNVYDVLLKQLTFGQFVELVEDIQTEKCLEVKKHEKTKHAIYDECDQKIEAIIKERDHKLEMSKSDHSARMTSIDQKKKKYEKIIASFAAILDEFDTLEADHDRSMEAFYAKFTKDV